MALELNIPATLDADQADAFDNGAHRGYDHVNYALAYGTGDPGKRPEVPARFNGETRLRGAWMDGYGMGASQAQADHDALDGSDHFDELRDAELDRLELAGDERAVYAEVLTARHEDREISDACARVVANWWHGGQRSPGYAFVSTGAIHEDGPTDLWRATGGRERDEQDPWMRDTLDAYGTYLVRRANDGNTGPVEGWSRLWVR